MHRLFGLYLHDVFILNGSFLNLFCLFVELSVDVKTLQWSLDFVLDTLIFLIARQMNFNIKRHRVRRHRGPMV